jgi:hypothetical protein
MRTVRHLGALTAALFLPIGAAAQNDHPPAASVPGAHTTPSSDSTQTMMQGMADRMQAMHQMMQEMHAMMQGGHGQQGGGRGGQGMQGMQGQQGGGQGMQGMRGQGQGMGAAGSQACLVSDPSTRLSALLAGPVGQLALSEVQWTELLGVLAAAQSEALETLTDQQRALLETARADAGACPQGAALPN